MTLQSQVVFRNVNFQEIGKNLRILCSDDELKSKKLFSLVPARILDLIGKKMKVQPTYLESDPMDSKWVWRQNWSPSRSQKQRMIALYLAKISSWIMTHHTYRFNDEIFKQSSGTPIGLQIAVSISRLVMVDWDEQMTAKLLVRNLRIELFLRYVDDLNLILRVNRMEFNTGEPLDLEVSKTIKELADSIMPGVLVFEADCPSNHQNNRLPILDLECWPQNGIVMFSFYKKRSSY